MEKHIYIYIHKTSTNLHEMCCTSILCELHKLVLLYKRYTLFSECVTIYIYIYINIVEVLIINPSSILH